MLLDDLDCFQSIQWQIYEQALKFTVHDKKRIERENKIKIYVWESIS